MIFTLETLVYLIPTFVGSTQADWIQLPFVVNSVVKAAVLGGVCWIAGADVRRFSSVLPVLYIGTAGWVLVGADRRDLRRGHAALRHLRSRRLGRLDPLGRCGARGIADRAVLLPSPPSAESALQARLLLPVSFQTLAALAEVLVAGPDERISPEKTAQNADAYLAGFHAKRKWLIKVALLGLYLYPLLTIRPPLPLMAAEERLEFLKKRFLYDVETRRIHGFHRDLMQGMIRLGQQIAFLGYYGDPRDLRADRLCAVLAARALRPVDGDDRRARRPSLTTIPHRELEP